MVTNFSCPKFHTIYKYFQRRPKKGMYKNRVLEQNNILRKIIPLFHLVNEEIEYKIRKEILKIDHFEFSHLDFHVKVQ